MASRRFAVLALRALVAFATAGAFGCALPVAPYEVSYDNVKALATASVDRVAVDRFTTSRSDTTMSMRGVDRAVSPVGDGFADYLRDALQREIRRANLLDEEAPTRLSGNIVENHFRTWKGQTAGARHRASCGGLRSPAQASPGGRRKEQTEA